MHKLTREAHLEYKVGVDEVVGLKTAMQKVMQPVADALGEIQSWGDRDWFKLEELEYKSRDGFSAHSHNHGGIEISSVIPECGQMDFPMLAWPEYTPSDKGMSEDAQDEERETEAVEGYLDSHLRIILKFEGIDETTGHLTFYINACTCDEAPYFRLKYSSDLFESEFTCASVKGLERASARHIKAMMRVLGDK